MISRTVVLVGLAVGPANVVDIVVVVVVVVVVAVVAAVGVVKDTVARTPLNATLISLVNVTNICWLVPVRVLGTVEPLLCNSTGELVVAPLYTV